MTYSLIQGLSSYTAAYLDNLVIFNTSWKEHIKHIGMVMERLHSAGLTARPKKCQFGMARCLHLGLVVENGTVHPEESKIEAVRSFPTPNTKKELRAFLGPHRHSTTEDYSIIALPLADLTRKSKPNALQWIVDCEHAFVFAAPQCLCH